MSSFCRECSIDLFGEDGKDLAGFGPLEPGTGWRALCEDCGPIVVDNDGTCISVWCEKHGKNMKREITRETLIEAMRKLNEGLGPNQHLMGHKKVKAEMLADMVEFLDGERKDLCDL